jgi:serpin B
MARNRQIFGLFAIGVLSVIVACAHSDTPEPVAPQAQTGTAAVDARDVKAATDGLTAFAAELYDRLRKEQGNLIVSPYSIGTALALTAAGAQGETYNQIQKVIRLPGVEKIGPAYGSLAAAVVAPPRNVKYKPELTTANSLWIQQGHQWKKDYMELATSRFHAGIFNVNFGTNPEGARRLINVWADKETRHRIRELMPEGTVNNTTNLVLANAVYFKAHWLDSFKEADTKPADFTLSTGAKVKTPLMYQSGHFSLVETDRLQVLKLPYDGNASSLYVILPRVANELSAIEQELSAGNLSKWIQGNEAATDVKVWLPKFKYAQLAKLVPTLRELGIQDAFDGSKANFKGMVYRSEGLCISDVIHKAFVEVDETGTEAAAATAVVFGLSASPIAAPPPKEFKADHPFLFVIKHDATGAVLFMGRVADPTK